MKGCEVDLGYDPRPELDHWRGTPIPPVKNALRKTPRRMEIADRVWWNGPPWTVLRNASNYLWHVMDYGRVEDVRFTQTDVPCGLWKQALEEARPGLLSKRSYVLWSLVFDRIKPGELSGWPHTAHRMDWRPLEWATREQLYLRHERRHHAQ